MGMMMIGSNQAFAETENGSGDLVETVGSTTESTTDSVTKSSDASALDTEAVNSEAGSGLEFSYLSYYVDAKTIYGMTVPNATIDVTIPNTNGQTIQADESGHFQITAQFTPGMAIVLVAHDALGNTGEPLTYTLPSQDMIDGLMIKNVSFDHKTKQLTGKTAPNASIGVAIEIEAGGQGTYKADAQGNFVISEQLDSGTPLVITATVDGVTGESFRYTIPEETGKAEETVKATTESTKAEVKETESTDAKSTTKKGFPNTGENRSLILLSVGILLVLAAGFVVFKRKFNRNR